MRNSGAGPVTAERSVVSKKKHKKKRAKQTTLAFVGGAVASALAKALGKILSDAVEVAAERLTEVEEKASKAIKKKKRHAVDGLQAVTS
jgi:hypothetical protein